MANRVLGFLAAASVLWVTAAEARPGDRLRERIEQRRANDAGLTAAADRKQSESKLAHQRISYGPDKAQRVLFYPAPPPAANERRRAPPLAIYIHGGGWANGEPEMVAQKPEWFAAHGWAFASIGYRMLPGAPVEEQARDVGRALQKLRAEAGRLGYDPDRILLTGHSAGAHLAALVSTDPQYAGTAFAAIRGTIPIDGACYDVPAQMEQSGAFMRKRTYEPAFGTEPARQHALSPVTHAGGADVRDWLLLYTTAREDARLQTDALAGAVRKGGAKVEVFAVKANSKQQLRAHRDINVDFGTPDYAANARIEAIMQRVAS